MGFFVEDISIFYLTLYGGIVIGLLFDLYRALRSNFKIVKKISFLFDAIFWLLITIVIFTTINLLERFDLRYYHFVALFLGFILYTEHAVFCVFVLVRLLLGCERCLS